MTTPRIFLLTVLLFAAGCASVPVAEKDKANLLLQPASFADLDGWANDAHGETLAAFQKSCNRIMKLSPGASFGTLQAPGMKAGEWQPACREALAISTGDSAAARAFFERFFTPYQATGDGDPEGLFTGYYESTLNGSRTQHGPYQYPLRARPGDLVMVNLGDFRPELKGQRIAGRVVSGTLKPYEDHEAIVSGKLPGGEDKPLVWVDDPIDAFFIQIQGSGTIGLDDGTSMRLGYAAQNGHPYYAIGRELVKRGELPKDDVSMQSIRAWLDAHPDQTNDILFTNKSYVFFQELSSGPDEGPKGAEGVSLTPGRSLAVDHAKIPYGVPVWVDIDAPGGTGSDLRRLVVAQDTGGAIIGPVRGDFFWGRGHDAEQMAGRMKSKGRMWLLLPRV